MHSQTPQHLIIATRASKLALWQSEHIAAKLRQLYPSCQVDLLPMSTKGDEILDRSLAKIGGKGLFIKELENALLDGRAHLAVHSLKDVPVDLDDRFSLAAITVREDPRDALVGIDDLGKLPTGAVVGTSSLRRQGQILARYPQLRIEPLRGNLDTRLGKLDSGQYQAIVLAASGLIRLGYQHRIAAYCDPDWLLPAAGQGALGIECLASNLAVQAWLAPLHHSATADCVLAERAVAQALGASCSTPLAAFATRIDEQIQLHTWVANPDGSQAIRLQHSALASNADAAQLGRTAAQDLVAQGAHTVLSTLS